MSSFLLFTIHTYPPTHPLTLQAGRVTMRRSQTLALRRLLIDSADLPRQQRLDARNRIREQQIGKYLTKYLVITPYQLLLICSLLSLLALLAILAILAILALIARRGRLWFFK